MAVQAILKTVTFTKQVRGHTRAQPPAIDINQPGRLRVAHVMCLLAISHSTLYAGIKTNRYPSPDGYDGKIPFWKTETIKKFLDGVPFKKS